MIYSTYIEDLQNKLKDHFENINKQQGKFDIESDCMLVDSEEWYESILSYVIACPPVQYVKTINITLDTQFNITSVDYGYCDVCDYVPYISINLFYD